jgi:hypothetical protein
LWEEARLWASGVEGVLRFGFARSGLYDTTPRLIAAMRESHPEIEIVGVDSPHRSCRGRPATGERMW